MIARKRAGHLLVLRPHRRHHAGELASHTRQTNPQVVALGGDRFNAIFLPGGLPGAGGDGKERIKASSASADGRTTLVGRVVRCG